MHRKELTHSNERNLFIVFIAGNPCRVGIEHWLAVHQKPILMMAMTELHLGQPPAIQRLFHGKRTPLVEIADEFDRFGERRGTIKVDRLVRVFGGITRVQGIVLLGIHKNIFSLMLSFHL